MPCARWLACLVALAALPLAALACGNPDGPVAARPAQPPESSPAQPPESSPAQPRDAAMRWQLRAEPSDLTMATRDTFSIRLLATNEGSDYVDSERDRGQWFVNGAPHLGLGLWFGNGVRAPEWDHLPPGATAWDERRPGPQLFERPGRYTIRFVHDGAFTEATVTVRP